jgi:8-oxo-dGTP pyrophosphatase MutT (NUDIX family)
MSSEPREGGGRARGGRGGRGARGRRRGRGRAGDRPRRERSERERSAGGVVVRGDEVVVIVPTRRASDGSKVLALPKGHIDAGENEIEAATREVREETGIVGEPVHELGESRYWYRRDGQTIPKSVLFFLFEYVEGDTADHDDEVEEARWMPLAEACSALSHAAEREILARASAYLQEGRKDR